MPLFHPCSLKEKGKKGLTIIRYHLFLAPRTECRIVSFLKRDANNMAGVVKLLQLYDVTPDKPEVSEKLAAHVNFYLHHMVDVSDVQAFKVNMENLDRLLVQVFLEVASRQVMCNDVEYNDAFKAFPMPAKVKDFFSSFF